MPLRTRCGTSRLPCMSLGVRAQGLGPRGGGTALAITICSVLPSVPYDAVGPPKFILLSRLNIQPARLPVNASPLLSRTTTHDSGPIWFATPSLGGTCTRETYRFVPAHFAVGTALTGGPPHRSQRALLTHWAPTSGHDAQSLFGIRVQCSMLDDFHQPSVVDGIEESTDVRVGYPVHFLVNRAPLSRQATCRIRSSALSQIRGPNVGALPWLFPRFLASCPFRVVHIHSLPGAVSGT